MPTISVSSARTVRLQVGELEGLHGAAGGVVLGVEIEHQVLAAAIAVQRDAIHIGVG
jgi:hypothetical protein